MIEYQINNCYVKYKNLYIGSTQIYIDENLLEKLVVENLPENQLVWHVNKDKDSSFFNQLYPEWSVVPHPKGWVAGNIYYSTKQEANKALAKALQVEIDRISKQADLLKIQKNILETD